MKLAVRVMYYTGFLVLDVYYSSAGLTKLKSEENPFSFPD